MATPEILDFATLLQPIREDLPAGPALKEDDRLRNVYQSVKDAREAARAAEKKLHQAAWLYADDEDGAGASNLERPDWQKVYELATGVLARQSKDLWIAAWLIEALARLHGFAGLRDGFRLARELAEQFWDGIHPRPDEEGYATTVAQLTGLNGADSEGALIAPIDHIPITAGGTIRPLSSADYKHALELDKLDSERRARRVAKGAASLEMFQRAVAASEAHYYRGLLDDLQQALDEFSRLGETLEARCGTSADGYPAAPPSSAIRAALVDVRDRVQALAGDSLGAASPSEEAASGDGGSGENGGSAETAFSGKRAATREEAFRQLLQVAEFFRKTEPHSPVSYALEQAVRWGRMSLPDLLNELIADSSAREDLFRRVGLPKRDED